MKSYATVDRLESNYAVCEVELITVEKSNTEDYFEHPTVMMDIPMSFLKVVVGEVREDDILVVEHDGRFVTNVHAKALDEKRRRIEVYDRIMNS